MEQQQQIYVYLQERVPFKDLILMIVSFDDDFIAPLLTQEGHFLTPDLHYDSKDLRLQHYDVSLWLARHHLAQRFVPWFEQWLEHAITQSVQQFSKNPPITAGVYTVSHSHAPLKRSHYRLIYLWPDIMQELLLAPFLERLLFQVSVYIDYDYSVPMGPYPPQGYQLPHCFSWCSMSVVLLNPLPQIALTVTLKEPLLSILRHRS